jgi:hypothetical protein
MIISKGTKWVYIINNVLLVLGRSLLWLWVRYHDWGFFSVSPSDGIEFWNKQQTLPSKFPAGNDGANGGSSTSTWSWSIWTIQPWVVQLCLKRISATVSAFIIETLEVLGWSNLNFMTFVLLLLTLFVSLRHGSMTCSVITIYFIIDTPIIGLTNDGRVLTAITTNLGSCRCRYELELCSEWVWVEIPTVGGINLLIGNHYFTPGTKLEVITDYFWLFENILDTNNFCVIILWDFNAPGFNWESGSPLPNCHYYSELKGIVLYTPPHVFLPLDSPLTLLTAITCLT